MYKVDWEKYLKYNVPTGRQRPRHMDWIRVLISQVKNGWNDFIAFRHDILYKMNHTGQVIYLEKALNDNFDNDQRRIEVVDGDFVNRLFLYQDHEVHEDKPLWIYPQFDEEKSYLTGVQVHHEHVIYEALVDDPQSTPGDDPAEWDELGEVTLLKTPEDYRKGARFYVLIPEGLVYNENQLKAFVNYYRIAPYNWKIVEI